MNLVDRAKNILMQPKQEWAVISAETHTVQGLYTNYAMILAAIPAVAWFIGFSIVGVGMLGISYHVPIAAGVAHMVVSYLLNLGLIYVLALIIDALAPSFGGEKNFMQALKVSVFAATASWLAGVFAVVPALSILTILGLYTLYLLYTGLPILMRAPEEKAMGYTAVVIIAAIVLFVVVGAVASLVVPSTVRGF